MRSLDRSLPRVRSHRRSRRPARQRRIRLVAIALLSLGLLVALGLQLGQVLSGNARGVRVVADLPPLSAPVPTAAAVAPSAPPPPELDFILPMEPLPPLASELVAPPMPSEPDEATELAMVGPRDREMGIEALDLVEGLVAIDVPAVTEPRSPTELTDERIAARAMEEVPPPPDPAPRQRSAAVFPPSAMGRLPAKGATVAIIIDDVGPAHSWSARAMALPGPLTMSFLPYAEALPQQIDVARRNGHEIFLHMPMQPIGNANPGRNALLVGMSAGDIRERVEWAIGRVGSAVGMNNHMGSRMTADASAMHVVMEVLREHGLMFVDSRTSGRSVAESVAAQEGLPHTARDVFLDHFPGHAFVRQQLAELEGRARRGGTAVAIGHPLPTTMDVLEEWIPGAKARGLRFVRASEMIALRGCDGRSAAGKCGLLHAAAQRLPPDDG